MRRRALRLTARTSVKPENYEAVGAGLGLRRPLLKKTLEAPSGSYDFLEAAPENWIGTGGSRARFFSQIAERSPIILHGLSLNLGGQAPLNIGLVEQIGKFSRRFGCKMYSEHLTACADHGQLYDLMPVPFTDGAVHHIASRIRQVQEILGERIAVENPSYYLAPGQQIAEIDFILAVVSEADCDLLLDINNIHVNSINHHYDPQDFLSRIPGERVRYIHIAGHYKKTEELRIDTHGCDVSDKVWQLLESAYRQFGVRPTVLERDNDFPPFDQLLAEVAKIRQLQELIQQERPSVH